MQRTTIDKDFTRGDGTRVIETRIHDDRKILPSSQPHQRIETKPSGERRVSTYDEKSIWRKWK